MAINNDTKNRKFQINNLKCTKQTLEKQDTTKLKIRTEKIIMIGAEKIK
jgi:hypothetical protein